MAEYIVSHRDPLRRALIRPVAPLWMLPPSAGRAMDVVVALFALVLFAPLMLLVAAAVLCERRGPVIFTHPRIGKDGQTFNVLKFRSMSIDGDMILAEHLRANKEAAAEWRSHHKLKNDPRVTPLGHLLRKSSLDELPQILNVLIGNMSVVGPRPIVEGEIARYGRFFGDYCSVRPGITGVWQVSGRNNVSYRRRVAMDVIYARRKSVVLDLKLMLLTIPAVLTRSGSY